MYNLNNEQNIYLDKNIGKNNIEMAQDQQQVQHLEDDLHIRMMVRVNM